MSDPIKPERPTVDITGAEGGWPDPWPNVAEIASVLSADRWTLVGGLMTQLHSVHHGLGVVRPTNDVDIVLHIETTRGVADATAGALRALGYELRSAVGPRNNTAHRFLRGTSTIDLVTGAPEEADKTQEIVDVLVSDHHAPSVTERLAGRDMVQIEGGTQALRRTINARLEITPGTFTTISVPRPFGAVVLKSAAHKADSRDPDRHLYDAAALLACIDDPARRARGDHRLRPPAPHLAPRPPPSRTPCLDAAPGTGPRRRNVSTRHPHRLSAVGPR